MKRDSLLERALLVFGIALLLYLIAYTAIEHRRTRRGPWQVTFTNGPPNVAAILINHPKLGITNVQISFVCEAIALTNDTRTLEFGQARPVPFAVPFGKCLFLDTTFLPGTVALDLLGHEIQLLPRVLTIDRIERPWRSGETIALTNALRITPAK